MFPAQRCDVVTVKTEVSGEKVSRKEWGSIFERLGRFLDIVVWLEGSLSNS